MRCWSSSAAFPPLKLTALGEDAAGEGREEDPRDMVKRNGSSESSEVEEKKEQGGEEDEEVVEEKHEKNEEEEVTK